MEESQLEKKREEDVIIFPHSWSKKAKLQLLVCDTVNEKSWDHTIYSLFQRED